MGPYGTPGFFKIPPFSGKDNDCYITCLHYLFSIKYRDYARHLKKYGLSYLDSLDPETHWKKSRQTLDHGDSFFQEFRTTSVASCDEDYAPCKTVS